MPLIALYGTIAIRDRMHTFTTTSLASSQLIPPSLAGAGFGTPSFHSPDGTAKVSPSDSGASVDAWFTDMDGTLYKGELPSNPDASKILHDITDKLDEREIPVVYISGRPMRRIEEAIEDHDLVLPAFVGASVGSEIYVRGDGKWCAVESYRSLMRERWIGDAASALDALMSASDLPRWRRIGETEFRRTYLLPNYLAIEELRGTVDDALRRHGLDTIKAVISGPDHRKYMHVDFVPDNGSKLDAALYIVRELLGLEDLAGVLFTGNGGNDADLLLAAGLAALVRTNESCLVEKLSALRRDIFFSPYPDIYGVRDAMEHFGLIGREPV